MYIRDEIYVHEKLNQCQQNIKMSPRKSFSMYKSSTRIVYNFFIWKVFMEPSYVNRNVKTSILQIIPISCKHYGEYYLRSILRNMYYPQCLTIVSRTM